MSGTLAVASPTDDAELVARVRAGDDAAFEELYRRYKQRISGYVRRMVGDEARAEDVTQEVFLSALRRLRATDSEIYFKPWIYEIARNASIDLYRRTSRAEELSIDADDELHPADRGRLVGSAAPDSMAIARERLDHLRGAFDELSDVHARLLVMRELEGMSYREIGERLQLSRSSVESALFRARRKLEHEYEELSEGRRCESMGAVIGRLAEGMHSTADERRLSRHARRCHACRRRARELGVEPLSARARVPSRAAVLLPLPWLVRRSGQEAAGGVPAVFGTASHIGAAIAERAATFLAAAAIAGAGGAAIAGGAFDHSDGDRPAVGKPAAAETRMQQHHASAATAAKRARHDAAEPATVRRRADAPARGERRKAREGAVRSESRGDAAAPGVSLPALPSLPAVKPPVAPQAPDVGVDVPDPPPVSVPQSTPPPPVEVPEAQVPQAPPPTVGELGGAVSGAVEKTLGADLP